MLYMVKEGHVDTARDIVLIMLVNRCASHCAPCNALSCVIVIDLLVMCVIFCLPCCRHVSRTLHASGLSTPCK